MKSRTSLITIRIIMFYMVFYILLSVVGRSTAIEEVPVSSLHVSRLNPLLSSLEYDQPSEKRAYAYISEYKRLPLFNFGIGKRGIDNSEYKRTRPEFSFGIGKRLKNYGFGIGKRISEYHPSDMDYFSVDNMEGYHSREDNQDNFIDDKRAGQRFDFGIGKRDWKLAMDEMPASGRRLNDVGSKYLLGLSKGLSEDENLSQ